MSRLCVDLPIGITVHKEGYACMNYIIGEVQTTIKKRGRITSTKLLSLAFIVAEVA